VKVVLEHLAYSAHYVKAITSKTEQNRLYFSLLQCVKTVVMIKAVAKKFELYRCTDTLDLRHFVPKTFRHYMFGAEVSDIFAPVKCLGQFDSSALKCMSAEPGR